MRVAINGFGRIGRSILKRALEKKINIMAINDIHGIEDASYLLEYDSVYGRYPGKISTKNNNLIVNNKKIQILQQRDPLKLPWKKLKIDYVIESTGQFRDRKSAEKHIKAGAKKVIMTAPMKNPDITVVPGVNHKKLKKSYKLISVASCTTNCAATVLKVIDSNFKIKRALLTTIHGYTSSQSLVDDSDEKDPRRGRAGAVNIIPSTTGASKAVVEVLPNLKGKVNGLAVRVPIPDGSLLDLVIELNKPFNVKKVNSALKKSSKNEMKGILEYSEDRLVSSDIIGNPHSSIIDSLMTQEEGNLLKILAWYDNEYGYSCRVVDVVKILGKL